MQLCGGTFAEMAAAIERNGSKIVMFGAGVIGTSTTPAILENFGLERLIVCYIDNDRSKWGKDINVGRRKIHICAPDILFTLGENTAVLINISRYADVFDRWSRWNVQRRCSATSYQ